MKKKLLQLSLWVGCIALIIATFTPLYFVLTQPKTATMPDEKKQVALIETETPLQITQTATSKATKPGERPSEPKGIATGVATAQTEPTAEVTVIPTPTPGEQTTTPSTTPTVVANQGSGNGQMTLISNIYYGYDFTLEAKGFQVGESVTFYWDYQGVGQVVLGDAVADANGVGVFGCKAPSGPRVVKVAAIGKTSGKVDTMLVLEHPMTLITPTIAAPGATIQFKGGGMARNESVIISMEEVGKTIPLTTVFSDKRGEFSGSFTAPPFSGPSNAKVVALGKSSGTLTRSIFGFPVSITPALDTTNSVPTLTVKGYHFNAFGVVDLYLIDERGSLNYLPVATPGADGAFTEVIRLDFPIRKGTTVIIEAVDGVTKAEVRVPLKV